MSFLAFVFLAWEDWKLVWYVMIVRFQVLGTHTLHAVLELKPPEKHLKDTAGFFVTALCRTHSIQKPSSLTCSPPSAMLKCQMPNPISSVNRVIQWGTGHWSNAISGIQPESRNYPVRAITSTPQFQLAILVRGNWGRTVHRAGVLGVSAGSPLSAI